MPPVNLTSCLWALVLLTLVAIIGWRIDRTIDKRKGRQVTTL